MSKKKKQGYDWKFCTVGGVTRVVIESGKDIEHLPELDQKLWTVLSCPTKGLEIDETTLKMLDTNEDGKIHVNEVIAAAKWLTGSLKNPDLLLKRLDHIELSAFSESEEGAKLLEESKAVLAKAGTPDKEDVNLEDTSKALAILAEESAAEAGDEGKVLPYGEDTEAALAAVEKIKSKIDDYFMRCRLSAFNNESAATLDLSAKRIEAISEKNLPDCIDEISTYPLFRIDGRQTMPLEGVNPAWKADFDALKSLVFDKDFAGAESISEADWQAVQTKLAAYKEWKDNVQKEVDKWQEGQKAEAEKFTSVDRFLHIFRDFYKLLHNFVTFQDFYSRDDSRQAIFQAGKLYIDQRCFELCVKVSDMGKQDLVADKSNMFILYCDCVSKAGGAMKIAAVVTAGDINNFHVGQNAIFYDRDGLDWDATIFKIVDNPINVRQAFWTPYKKFGKWCSEKFNKKVSDKEEGSSNLLSDKAADVKVEEGAGKKQAFDIAKFAGIFAAIGMALGFLLDALVGLLDSILKMPWWGIFVLIAAIMLIISGPAMIIAWIKLRRRSLSPVLNANGWAINSRVLVNTRFGSTFTSLAKYPKVVGKDPYTEKVPVWKKILRWFIAIVIVLGITFLILWRHDKLHFLGIERPQTEVVEEAAPAENEASATETAADADVEAASE
jgi:hypothetical protein